jgi:hypothetical protein
MPSTRARTWATRTAFTRPGNSTVTGTWAARAGATVTLGGGGWGGGAVFSPQAATDPMIKPGKILFANPMRPYLDAANAAYSKPD